MKIYISNYYFKFFNINIIVLLFILPLFTSCISVDIKPDDPKPLSALEFKAPDQPFKKISSDLISGPNSHSWQSAETGNLISLITHCPSLYEEFYTDFLSSLKQTQILEQKTSWIDQRPARHTLIEGLKEGIAFKAYLIQYEKKGCSIASVYLGQKKAFASELPLFEQLSAELKSP